MREALYLHAETDLAFGLDRVPLPEPVARGGAGEDAWALLAGEVRACTACVLHEQRIQAVLGEGNPDADLLFVGEAPGAEEDRQGRPFVGKAGRLLTRMIEAMGFRREQVYIANVIKCRPPGNRTPSGPEMACCRPYLDRQIRLIAPRVIVALGAPAARTLLETQQGINALRGRKYPYPRREDIRVVPTFHPAYLLRNTAEKGKGWKDLQIAMKILGRPAP
jgi:DNA polymerase